MNFLANPVLHNTKMNEMWNFYEKSPLQKMQPAGCLLVQLGGGGGPAHLNP